MSRLFLVLHEVTFRSSVSSSSVWERQRIEDLSLSICSRDSFFPTNCLPSFDVNVISVVPGPLEGHALDPNEQREQFVDCATVGLILGIVSPLLLTPLLCWPRPFTSLTRISCGAMSATNWNEQFFQIVVWSANFSGCLSTLVSIDTTSSRWCFTQSGLQGLDSMVSLFDGCISANNNKAHVFWM